MFIDVPDESSVSDDVSRFYERQRTSWGYLPNYALAFATRPDVAETWTALSNAVGKGMERRRFELATIAAARALRSTYCMAAHCKFLRDDVRDETTMQAIADDPTLSALDPTDRSVMEFASLVARDAAAVTEADVQRLRDNGLTDADIADVVFAAAARTFFTKVLDALGVQADFQLGASFDPETRQKITVGRPIADS
jgi:uncharacterized peroxidase-related enzyme